MLQRTFNDSLPLNIIIVFLSISFIDKVVLNDLSITKSFELIVLDYIFHEYHAIQWEFKRYDFYLATVLIITITQKQCIWVPCATSLFGLLFAVWNSLRNRFRWKSLDFPFLQHFFFLNSKIELRASSKMCSMPFFLFHCPINIYHDKLLSMK